MKIWIQNRLQQHTGFLVAWAGAAAFLSYFAMYMFRKPFTAGTYDTIVSHGLDFKSILVISQIIGYAISKFIGIRFISSLQKKYRYFSYLACILLSEFALILFALFPTPFGGLFLLLSGLPLGLIWGIVFQYLEGRKVSEILTVMLSANFVLASGVAKSIGSWCLQMGVNETSMPAVIGIFSIPLCFVAVWMLEQIPEPNNQDVLQRQLRVTMGTENRKSVFRQYGSMLLMFSLIYIVLTAIRDVRDNFAVEIWHAMGYKGAVSLYTMTELPVTMVLLISLGMLFLIKDNRKALRVQFGMIGISILLFLFSTVLYFIGSLPPTYWMIVSGIGLFIPYILFNGILFDRMIAAFQMKANVGFFMYLVDTAGYVFSVFIIFWKTMGGNLLSWLDFYLNICLIGGSLLLILVIPLWYIFKSSFSIRKI
jgi:hypothetical protein